jgi:hypothetical protein
MTEATPSNSMPKEMSFATNRLESLCYETLYGLRELALVIHEAARDGMGDRAQTLALLAADYADMSAAAGLACIEKAGTMEGEHHG